LHQHAPFVGLNKQLRGTESICAPSGDNRLEFCELLLRNFPQCSQRSLLRLIIVYKRCQLIELRTDLACSVDVRRKILVSARYQVSALARLGVAQQRKQPF